MKREESHFFFFFLKSARRLQIDISEMITPQTQSPTGRFEKLIYFLAFTGRGCLEFGTTSLRPLTFTFTGISSCFGPVEGNLTSLYGRRYNDN